MALGLRSYRPVITGTTHAVTAGHYLAAAAGYRILEQGGNAVDAGVAAAFAINVCLPQYTCFGGVAPTLIHISKTGETVEVAGLGRWPKAASIEYFNKNHNGQLPPGIPRTVTPAALDAWLTSLRLYGTMSFEQVVTPALEIAENGFPIPESLARALQNMASGRVTDEGEAQVWLSTRDIFFREGRPLRTGEILVQEDMSRTLRLLIDVERGNACQSRAAGILAARDFFYKGRIAETIVRFHQEQGGLLTLEDMAAFQVKVGAPAHGNYKGIDLFTCDTWCQGPATIEALQSLEGFDLKGMGHNSPDYLHTLLESLKLAFADRHAYFGDPDFVDVPLAGLLSREYAAERRQQVDPRRASPDMPAAGNPNRHQARAGANGYHARPLAMAGHSEPDTTHISVVDRWGNAFSSTPSDGIAGSPIVPGLGFAISARGSQSWLDPAHPAALAPGKRPRLTPAPSMALNDGKVFLSFGTPGGDVQCQTMTQFFLNVVEFGMDPQQAAEAPRAATWSYPGSFWPHAYTPGSVTAEGRIAPETVAELRSRGHKVDVVDDWTPRMGCACGVLIDQQSGGIFAGADPRRDGYAIGR